jgi:hypothetical protein
MSPGERLKNYWLKDLPPCASHLFLLGARQAAGLSRVIFLGEAGDKPASAHLRAQKG